MNILVINSGSSSIKFQLIDMENESVTVKGNLEKIAISGSKISYSACEQDYEINIKISSHHEALENIIKILTDKNSKIISSIDEIGAVGHRVVHGGEKLVRSEIVTEEIEQEIEKTFPLAPLHNPPSLEAIKAMKKILPNVSQVAVFDTAFHSTIPKHASIYAIPYKFYETDKIKKYGFHGISHSFVTSKAENLLKMDIKDLKIIIFHLGNGSSCSAIKNGKSVDTSMGFTPMDGLIMGTRCGSIDPAIISFLSKEEKMSVEKIDNILNKESGVLGISGISSDFRDLTLHANKGNERAKLSLKMFCYSAKKYIGSFACVMGGLDVVIFTGGIGENTPFVRREIMKDLDFLGLNIDLEKNEKAVGEEYDISHQNSKIKTLVIPTNEELVIARETAKVLENMENK